MDNHRILIDINFTAKILLFMAVSTNLIINLVSFTQIASFLTFSKLAMFQNNYYYVLAGMLLPISINLTIALIIARKSMFSWLFLLSNFLLILTLTSLNSLGGISNWTLHTHLARSSLFFFLLYEILKGFYFRPLRSALLITLFIITTLLCFYLITKNLNLIEHTLILAVQIRIFNFKGGLLFQKLNYIPLKKKKTQTKQILILERLENIIIE